MTDPRDRPIFRSIAEEAAARFTADSTGHDVDHAWRVCDLGVRIAREEGADEEIVGAAALVHDVHRVRGDGFVHPRETLPGVREILRDAGFPAGKRDDVAHCVAVHEEYEFEADPEAAETPEAEILQDADNLDAIGAVGIGRAFAYGGAHGNRLWAPERERPGGPYDKTGGDEDRGSTIHHFRAKLLRLRDAMNTETGRRLAGDRHEFTERFVDRFEREWAGDL